MYGQFEVRVAYLAEKMEYSSKHSNPWDAKSICHMIENAPAEAFASAVGLPSPLLRAPARQATPLARIEGLVEPAPVEVNPR